MKPTLFFLLAYLIILSCKVNHVPPCELDKILYTMEIPWDSTKVAAFEDSLSSSIFSIPPASKDVIPQTNWGNYRYYAMVFRDFEKNGGFYSPFECWGYTWDIAATMDGGRFMLYHRKSPIEFLNIETVYCLPDVRMSDYGDKTDTVGRMGSVASIKIFHRDYNFAEYFPDMVNKDSFDSKRFFELYDCLYEHFQEQLKKEKDVIHKFLVAPWYADKYHLVDTKATTSLEGKIKIAMWRTDSMMIQIFIMPANRREIYETYDENGGLVAFNIDEQDLAIYITYRMKYDSDSDGLFRE